MDRPLFGILSDDLTGACDTAAQIVSFGFTAGCSIFPKRLAYPKVLYDAVVINTQSRCRNEREVKQLVKRGMQILKEEDPAFYIKKIDTALRGNIAIEILTMMEFGFKFAVFIAAIPKLGRITKNGRQLIGGSPIEDSPPWKDTVSTVDVPSSDILSLFQKLPNLTPILFSRGSVEELNQFFKSHSSFKRKFVLVFDAETQEEIDQIINHIRSYQCPILYVGSIGLMESLTKSVCKKKAYRPIIWQFPSISSKRILIACGSTHIASQRQIEHLNQTLHIQPIPFSTKKLEKSSSSAGTIEHDILCVYVQPEEIKSSKDESITKLFTDWVVERIMLEKWDYVIIVGGETAYYICKKLKIYNMEIIGLFSYVIAISKPITKTQKALPLILTKGGSVGETSILTSLVETLRSKGERT